MYTLITHPLTQQTNCVHRANDFAQIPFNPLNTDYQQFKRDIANNVQLADATGNVMTSSDVTTFLGTLP
jgi:hypothetical protein